MLELPDGKSLYVNPNKIDFVQPSREKQVVTDQTPQADHAKTWAAPLEGPAHRCSKRQPRASRIGCISRKAAAFFVSGIAG
jgi:hypothetical protein